jgi:glycosyltransferase involved in cell wall biosynthesis
MTRLRVLHAVHDFLPRHQAGSELYVSALARAQAERHDVFVLAAEYDPATPHGTLRWREHDHLPVTELVNNWQFGSFSETYHSPRVNGQLAHVLDATRPDILHIHNLLNLSFDLPQLARQRGARSVATLHDYTLVCPSGGQRVHVAEEHVCAVIDAERCARCFGQSPFYAQMAARRIAPQRFGAAIASVARLARRRAPWMLKAASRLPGPSVTAADIRHRLASARNLLETIDLFVAPSPALAEEYVRLGLPRDRLIVSDYGFEVAAPRPKSRSATLRIGFVGTLVWHKGTHVLLEAIRTLPGDYTVHLFGDPDTFPVYTARLKQLANGLPVVFHGRYDHARAAEVYAQIDVLVVPSLWPENSPLVIHEAFQHGAAVVAARMGGITDLVQHGVNGFLYDAFSPTALASVLAALLHDRGLAGRLAAAAPKVKSIAEDAREWDERYLSVLGAGASQPVMIRRS